MNGKIKGIVGLLAMVMVATGCTPTAARSSSSGSVALSKDDALVYAADTDNGTLNVIDPKAKSVIASVKVGDAPFRVTVASDDTIYVANRGSLDISVIRRGDWKEASRIALGAEPVGMQISQDDKTLFVVSSTTTDKAEVGSLTAIDTGSFQAKASTVVGNEPRGLALVGDRAIVSLFKQGELVEVDTKSMQVASNGMEQRPIYNMANASKLNGTTSGIVAPSSFRFRSLTDVVATPDGTRLFVPAVLAREDAIGRLPSAGGYYGSGGPCSIGAVASAGVLTLGVNGNASPTQTALEPKVDDLTKCLSSGSTDSNADWPTTTIAPRASVSLGSGATADPIQGPTVAAIDPTGSWLFVVNRESSNVAVMPTDRRDGADLDYSTTGNSVRDTVALHGAQIGSSGADGIAIGKDGTTAYVYNQFDHTLAVLTTGNKGTDKGPDSHITVTSTIAVTSDPASLNSNLSAGRMMFFDAVDSRLSAAGTNVSCATCHLEGTDDQHVWGFPDGERQTPSLAGRHLLATAPYHWSGEFTNIKAFMNHTITERMGGNGLSTDSEISMITSYIESLPTPFNPYVKAMPADQVARGALAFSKAQCATCHVTTDLSATNGVQAFTNNENRDVGTLITVGNEVDNGYVLTADNGAPGLNVPSLLNVARTSPYLHTGQETNLEARVNDGNSLHGNTSVLSAQEKADLVAYLKTL
ncbi:MAG: c-type cytochrome [Myxococcaceae bacterium]